MTNGAPAAPIQPIDPRHPQPRHIQRAVGVLSVMDAVMKALVLAIGQALKEALKYPSFQLLMAGYFVTIQLQDGSKDTADSLKVRPTISEFVSPSSIFFRMRSLARPN